MLGTEPQIIDSYIRTGQVRFVYRHLAQLGDDSVLAGEASECAADQNTFWEMRRALYANQQELYSDVRATSLRIAGELGMDQQAFESCLQSGTNRQAVLDDYATAQAEGVRSRPEFRVNSQRLVGALAFGEFQKAIDTALGR